jgi:hypothetical protein
MARFADAIVGEAHFRIEQERLQREHERQAALERIRRRTAAAWLLLHSD